MGSKSRLAFISVFVLVVSPRWHVTTHDVVHFLSDALMWLHTAMYRV